MGPPSLPRGAWEPTAGHGRSVVHELAAHAQPALVDVGTAGQLLTADPEQHVRVGKGQLAFDPGAVRAEDPDDAVLVDAHQAVAQILVDRAAEWMPLLTHVALPSSPGTCRPVETVSPAPEPASMV